MPTKNRLAKKQRSIALQMLDSESQKELRTSGMDRAKALPIVKGVVEANPVEFMKRDNMAKRVLSLWSEMIEQRIALNHQDMKWSDVLKASELMAKYAGMFADEKGDTFNTIVVNAKELDERALLERLQNIQQEAKRLSDQEQRS